MKCRKLFSKLPLLLALFAFRGAAYRRHAPNNEELTNSSPVGEAAQLKLVEQDSHGQRSLYSANELSNVSRSHYAAKDTHDRADGSSATPRTLLNRSKTRPPPAGGGRRERLRKRARRMKEEANRILLESAHRTPLYLILAGLLVAIIFLVKDHVDKREEERTCFNRLHDWEEGQGKKPGFSEILDYIKLDPGGGLHKIKDLMPAEGLDWARAAGAASVLFFALYNVVFIFQGDMEAMVNCAKFEYTKSTAGLSPQFEDLLGASGAAPIITDARTLIFVVCCEVIGLMIILVHFLVHVAVFFIHLKNEEQHYNSFFALWMMVDCLRLLCTYSMLKLLWLIHPNMVVKDITQAYVQIMEKVSKSEAGKFATYLHLVCSLGGTIIIRLVLMFVLFIAFGVKVAIVSTWIHYPDRKHLDTKVVGSITLASVHVWLAILNFLMQALGAMQLDRVLLDRVFGFVFSGNDGILNHKEYVMLKVFKARIAQVIYEEFWDTGRYVTFFALFLTLNDVDLQKMLLLSDETKKIHRLATMDKSLVVDEHGVIKHCTLHDGHDHQDGTVSLPVSPMRERSSSAA